MLTRRYQVIVFDWDGTLFDSCHHIVESMQEAIRGMDLSPHGHEEIRQLIGCGMFQLVQSLYPEVGDKERHQLIERYREHFFAGKHHNRLFPGVEETLSELQSQGYQLAIATSEIRKRLDENLRDLNIAHLFASSRCGDETFPKPHPQMLEEIMMEMGISAGQMLMVGDTEYDMQMAINAKVDRVAVVCGVHDASRLTRCEPKICLKGIKELPGWLIKNMWE